MRYDCRMRLQLASLIAALVLLAATSAAQQAGPPTPAPAEFSADEATTVLDKIVDGLAAHSASRMLSAFDRQHMEGYPDFADQVRVMFDTFDSFRARYHIRQTAMEGDRGMVLADFELEQTPRDATVPVRKQAQIRFVFERDDKQWKIVDLVPRELFS